jgi:hypothetical protein
MRHDLAEVAALCAVPAAHTPPTSQQAALHYSSCKVWPSIWVLDHGDSMPTQQVRLPRTTYLYATEMPPLARCHSDQHYKAA